MLNNLGPGTTLSAVKILLCFDLLFSYPLVLAAGRDIVEKSLGVDEDGGCWEVGDSKAADSRQVCVCVS